MRVLAPLALGLTLLLANGSCLVHSRCQSDSDCASPERCFSDGECRLECDETSTQFCTTERPYCSLPDYRCVQCLETEQCEGEAAECIGGRCIPIAPEFALVDQNPASPTFEETHALEDYRGRYVLIYFAGLG